MGPAVSRPDDTNVPRPPCRMCLASMGPAVSRPDDLVAKNRRPEWSNRRRFNGAGRFTAG